MLGYTSNMSLKSMLLKLLKFVKVITKLTNHSPLSPPEHPGGEGVNNELFTLGLDRFLRPLSIFE